MLSTDTRLRLQRIADRIANGEEVTLEEMTFIQKWANHNASAASILRRARRESIAGKTEPGSLDEFMNALDLGDPDPGNHVVGPQDPIFWAEWFGKPKWFRGDES